VSPRTKAILLFALPGGTILVLAWLWWRKRSQAAATSTAAPAATPDPAPATTPDAAPAAPAS
jgi:hypothetical protein